MARERRAQDGCWVVVGMTGDRGEKGSLLVSVDQISSRYISTPLCESQSERSHLLSDYDMSVRKVMNTDG